MQGINYSIHSNASMEYRLIHERQNGRGQEVFRERCCARSFREAGRHFPRCGEQLARVGGARHKEVSGLQCLWAEAQSSAKVSRLLPLDQRQPKVTIPEEEELRGVDQRKRWGEICARLNKDLETGEINKRALSQSASLHQMLISNQY